MKIETICRLLVLLAIFGFFAGIVVGIIYNKDSVNNYNDIALHMRAAKFGYQYCPYCGKYISSKDFEER